MSEKPSPHWPYEPGTLTRIKSPLSTTNFEQALTSVLDDLKTMLLEKNRKYGNSALDPIRVFSKADSREQILVRMDDKLSRIRTAATGDEEDAIQDLIGYLLLMRTGERMNGK